MILYLLMALLFVITMGGFIAVYFLLKKQSEELKAVQKNDQAISLVSQWMQETRSSMDSRLQETRQVLDSRLSDVGQKLDRSLDSVNRNVNDRLDNAARVIGDVQKQLGTLTKVSENMQEIGKDISSLQDILRSPKIRGGLGEYFLGDLLGQILTAPHYELQYSFRSGEKVDAVIKLSGKLVPVDAKFPLENFKKMLEAKSEEERKGWRRKFNADVKKHTDTIAKKYILPDEGTFDFALMYIPAENVYYETIIKDDNFGEEKSVSVYSIEQKVIPVSPNSLYAYLQAIILGLRGMRVEERAQEIIESLSRLKGDLGKFRNDFEVLGNHLGNAAKKYEEADKRLVKFEGRLESVEGGHISEGEKLSLSEKRQD